MMIYNENNVHVSAIICQKYLKNYDDFCNENDDHILMMIMMMIEMMNSHCSCCFFCKCPFSFSCTHAWICEYDVAILDPFRYISFR